MKLLLDFLPIVAFFATYKWGDAHKDAVAQWLTQHLGFMVNGGVVGPTEAAVMLATLVVVVLSLLQIVVMKALRKPIDKMLWISLIVVVTLGAMTLYFHSETFIKWKPTVLYWVMGGGLWISDILLGKFVLRAAMQASDLTSVPEAVWRRLSWAWIAFFAGMGVLNLYVAYHYSTDTWVNFKMWGSMGLMLVFVVGQGFYLSRHMPVSEGDKERA
ncbi:MAG: hypothetical protein RLZZ182_1627 [Pseudomonadota bacterium]|jgi:intracellular septation protein